MDGQVRAIPLEDCVRERAARDYMFALFCLQAEQVLRVEQELHKLLKEFVANSGVPTQQALGQFAERTGTKKLKYAVAKIAAFLDGEPTTLDTLRTIAAGLGLLINMSLKPCDPQTAVVRLNESWLKSRIINPGLAAQSVARPTYLIFLAS